MVPRLTAKVSFKGLDTKTWNFLLPFKVVFPGSCGITPVVAGSQKVLRITKLGPTPQISARFLHLLELESPEQTYATHMPGSIQQMDHEPLTKPFGQGAMPRTFLGKGLDPLQKNEIFLARWKTKGTPKKAKTNKDRGTNDLACSKSWGPNRNP